MVEPRRVLPKPSRNFWIIGAILCGATLLTFFGVLQLGFLEYDDNDYVLHNPLIYPATIEKVVGMFTRTYFRSYTPLAHLSHALDFALWGADPFGHHLTNLLLHTGNAALVYLVAILLFVRWKEKGHPAAGELSLRRILAEAPPSILLAAGAGSAFFALHPLRVESVAWISDRKDLLMATLVLVSLAAYLLYSSGRGTPDGKKWLHLSLGAGLLAMLAKSVASMLPLSLLLVDAAFRPREPGEGEGLSSWRAWSRLLREKLWLFVGSCFVGMMSVAALLQVRRHPTIYEESGLEKILLPFYTWAFYLGKTLYPADLTPTYVHPPLWQQALSVAAVAGLTAVAVWWYRRGRSSFLLFLWGVFLLFVAPTILGREKAGIQPWADRYSYLPGAVIGVLFGGILLWINARGKPHLRWGGGVAVAGILLGCAIHSTVLIPKWSDTVTLFRHAVSVNPHAVFAQANLGMALTSAGKPDEALEALTRAAELTPRFAPIYSAMGLAYDGKGEPERAAGMYRKALALDSNWVDAHSNLGNALMALGRFDDAIAEYREAIRKRPEFDDAINNMAVATYRKGDAEGALGIFRQAAEVNPIRAGTYVSMGIIYQERGDLDSAYQAFVRAAGLGHEQAAKLVKGWSWKP